MDLKSLLTSKKNELKVTKTVVTNTLGEKFEIFQGITQQLAIKGSPFVIDEKPDLQVVPILPGLYLSSQDPVFCDEILKFHDIKHILSLGIDPSVKFSGIEYHYLDILDLPEFNLTKILTESFKIINLNRHENILVHCNAGVSRSPMIVIGYLMFLEDLTYDEAYTRVKALRHCIKPNDGFVRQLKNIKFEDYSYLKNPIH